MTYNYRYDTVTTVDNCAGVHSASDYNPPMTIYRNAELQKRLTNGCQQNNNCGCGGCGGGCGGCGGWGCFPMPCPPFPPCPPYPPYPPASHNVQFVKTDSSNGSGLAGAGYSLYQDGQLISTATSAANGNVVFSNIPAGTYTMNETSAPAGYLPDPTTHTVHVLEDGSVLIDGAPASSFHALNTPISSAAPTIDTVYAGSSVITGTGTPGCIVMLYWPTGGSTPVIVDSNSIWAVPVPAGMALTQGQVVRATQSCSGGPEGPEATTIVLPLVTA